MDAALEGAAFPPQHLEFGQQLLPVQQQVLLFGKMHAHFGDLLLELHNQLEKYLPLLAKPSGLIDALGLLEVATHQSPKKIVGVKRSLLV